MTLIIYCHPSKTSHNYKILQRVKKVLDSKRRKYEVLNLYKMNFNAYYSREEYERVKMHIRTTDKDVEKMHQKILRAKTLIFIYPTWWYGMPARLKGFFDRCFSPGFAYKFFPVNKFTYFMGHLLSYIPGVRYLMQPMLVTHMLKIKKAYIFRTYGGPSSGKRIFDNANAALENVMLRFLGITDITIHELFNIDNKEIFSPEREDKYLNHIEKILS